MSPVLSTAEGALKVLRFNVFWRRNMAISPVIWILGAALALASSTMLGALQLLASSAVMHAAVPASGVGEMRLAAGSCLVIDHFEDARLWDGKWAIRPQ